MFSFFSKSGKQAGIDKVWQTKDYCVKGLGAEALLAIRNSRAPIVFYFFEDARDRFAHFLKANQISHETRVTGGEADTATSVLLLSAFALESAATVAGLTNLMKKRPLTCLFLGHYPLVSTEDKLIEKLPALDQAPVFGLSLDDPLFEYLGADHVRTLMATLGMKADECVEHALVSKAILRARKKMEASVTAEQKSVSEAGWYSKNIKQQL